MSQYAVVIEDAGPNFSAYVLIFRGAYLRLHARRSNGQHPSGHDDSHCGAY